MARLWSLLPSGCSLVLLCIAPCTHTLKMLTQLLLRAEKKQHPKTRIVIAVEAGVKVRSDPQWLQFAQSCLQIYINIYKTSNTTTHRHT